MMMPSIFGENLFNDWMDFSFPDIDKKLYGKRADRMMKTDVKETEHGYEVAIDLPGFKKDEVKAEMCIRDRMNILFCNTMWVLNS